MSLYSCCECDKKVAENATVCPHCGCHFSDKVGLGLSGEFLEQLRVDDKFKVIENISAVAAFAIFIVLVVKGAWSVAFYWIVISVVGTTAFCVLSTYWYDILKATGCCDNTGRIKDTHILGMILAWGITTLTCVLLLKACVASFE